MPPGPTTPEILHARAAALRSVALRLDRSSALALHRRAGPEVWAGATPRACLDDLVTARTTISASADTLRDSARALDQIAAHLATADVPVG